MEYKLFQPSGQRDLRRGRRALYGTPSRLRAKYPVLYSAIRAHGKPAREDILQVNTKPCPSTLFQLRECRCRMRHSEFRSRSLRRHFYAEEKTGISRARIESVLEGDLRAIARMSPLAAVNYIRQGMGIRRISRSRIAAFRRRCARNFRDCRRNKRKCGGFQDL